MIQAGRDDVSLERLSASDRATSERGRLYFVTLALAAIVLSAAIWLSSGTMAPYAATAQYPRILEPCHYLINVDHDHFAAVSAMIAGEPPERWAGSVVLRRVLFPVVAHPLIQTMGFLNGGMIASMLLNLVAMLAFAAFVRSRIGERAAITVAWLLATYPGVTYWAGLPYSYVAIVPGSLFALMLLYRLSEATSLRDAGRAALLLGVLFTGYDLAPFFGPAALLVLMAHGRARWIVPVTGAMAFPTLLVFFMLLSMGLPLVNSNTVGYFAVLFAYLRPRELHLWGGYLMDLPLVFLSNLVFGNLIFLPMLAAAGMVLGWRRRIAVLTWPEKALLLSALALFLFNNAAPPYYGWQLRGHWIARIYQPVFVALLIIVARITQTLTGPILRRWLAAIVIVSLANASIAFGPILMNPLAAYAYHKFYIHSPPESLFINLERFGRRPLGVCSSSHAWDNIPNPNTPFNRPRFMYRYPEEAKRGSP
jgi:hypothetical protein